MSGDFVLGLVEVDDAVKVEAVANEIFVDDDYVVLWFTSSGFCMGGRRGRGEGAGEGTRRSRMGSYLREYSLS